MRHYIIIYGTCESEQLIEITPVRLDPLPQIEGKFILTVMIFCLTVFATLLSATAKKHFSLIKKNDPFAFSVGIWKWYFRENTQDTDCSAYLL